MSPAGFAPRQDSDWPDMVADMRAGFAGQLNVYRIMAHHPALLRAWGDLRTHIVQNTALGPQRAEVVILRLAHRLDCAYEWNQHVVRALAAGLDKGRIASLRGSLAQMTAPDATLAGAVDALVDHKRLAPAQLDDVVAMVGKTGALDLMATVGMYMTLGFILNTAPPDLEPAIAQALAQQAPELAV
ncbi:carboxymuconolactone decarboxylase family protein [Roseinatronobacter alkalisoli]|uniref:Carboxymuconolactone decarboxylase family protein n=1 Tax=Roseinatronobacter alkalisoli TaxID=3028235 RepID=A0ABT5T5N4_9RHOB|nr:carboxymuconolactone decarboxylase family protein [Roseinatronobacter sp. HJB301]MDD7970296.1 carboxymuconolactone decarboxylase family protein [Roseinatronobacter sp. HJB301]